MALHVLFENASGFAIFGVKEFEDVGNELDSIQKAVADYGKFSGILKLISFRPFVSAENALENINAISEGMLPDLLKDFIELTFPNKSNVMLGVGEEKLAVAIQDVTGVKCQKNKKVTELIRGIRQHFHKFIKELNEGDIEKAQLGLGHSYSRSKVKFNVNKVDNMVIQSISLLDQLEKDLNTFCMRVREWYSWHFPELFKLVPDNYKFARLVKLIGNRLNLKEENFNSINDITEDQILTRQILDAASSSMGQEISEVDLINIEIFAKKVIELSEYKANLQGYLKKKVTDIAPNLTALIGELVSARLISHAGSLTTLAKYPASTIQILGAEKALFRALKTRGNTPKYGLIYHSSFIGKAPSKHKGRISRYLANKCSLASRIDCFTEATTSKFGETFKDQVEERLKFYETGAVPRKNEEVIQNIVKELKEEANEMDTKEDKPKSASKKRDRDSEPDSSAKKKKKKEKKEKKKEEATTPVSNNNQQNKVEAPKTPASENKEDSKKKKKKEKKERKSHVETPNKEEATTPVSSKTEAKETSSKKKKKKEKKSK